LTEAIHFGNDFNSSVASLRPLDAFLWNWWWPSVGIAGGIPRNTHDHRRAANELTITGWDPISKQPHFKFAAVRIDKVED
jgi:hypothetical protein